MADRDEKGRFLPGNSYGGARPGSGRTPTPTIERLRAALTEALTDDALKKWAAAIRKRIEAGDLDASAFVFDRILGKPVQMIDLAAEFTPKLYATWSPDDWPD